MSHPRPAHQCRAHTQTQTDRAYPKPRIGLTAPTRPATTTAVLGRRRNYLGVHSTIHQLISYVLVTGASAGIPRRQVTQRTPPLGWVKLLESPARTFRCCVAPTQHADDVLTPRWVLVEAIDDEFGARYRTHSMNVTGGKSMKVDQYCVS